MSRIELVLLGLTPVLSPWRSTRPTPVQSEHDYVASERFAIGVMELGAVVLTAS